METLISGILGCLILCFMIYFTKRSQNKNGKLPPGPRGLPFFGNLISMIKDPYTFLEKTADDYGSMFSLSLGCKSIVVVSEYNTMKAAMKMNVFQGRVKGGAVSRVKLDSGILAASNQLWQENRRFLLQSLRDMGVGKSINEKRIEDELQNVITLIKQFDGKPADLGPILQTSTSNIICQMALGKKFEYNDPAFIQILRKMNDNFYGFLVVEFWHSFKPWGWPFIWYLEYKLRKNRSEIMNRFRRLIAERKDNMNGSDIVGLYLQEMKNLENDEERRKYFNERQLLEICLDLFGAGTETSSTTIRWALLYMAENPDIQKTVQDEMDRVVGRSRLPSIRDRSMLQHSQAAVQEVERLATAAPFAFIHATLDEVEFNGWEFPKHTSIMYNIYSVHHSKEIWGDPNVFRPSRFLDQDGKVFRPEYLIPFGIGKRICPGESLGKAEIFLYITQLLHLFTFIAVPGEPNSDCKVVTGIVRSPPPYKIIAKSRPF